jgi:hypothetical protein
MLAQRCEPISHRQDDKEGFERCWALVRRAVLTHDALPGDKLQQLVAAIETVQEFQDAYGYTDVRPPRFIASARDHTNLLPALAWLCWLRRQQGGERDFKVVVSRCRNIPWWRLSDRFRKSEKQVQRYFDGAIAAIYAKFELEVWTLEPGK